MATEQLNTAVEAPSPFDAAAAAAEVTLKAASKKLDAATLQYVASWWSANYMAAGHKRLGRVLVKLAKANGSK